MWWQIVVGFIISGLLYYIALQLSDIHSDLIIIQHMFIQFNREYTKTNMKAKRGRKPKDSSELQK